MLASTDADTTARLSKPIQRPREHIKKGISVDRTATDRLDEAGSDDELLSEKDSENYTRDAKGRKQPKWWNSSRLRLLTIWLPLNVLCIVGISLIAASMYSIDRVNVSKHNTALLTNGHITLIYLIFIVLKDFGIFVSQGHII